jgi:NAD(P)-dependent dehydrogenase (short-subunit alcohol dehydrogenase family)
MRLEDKVAIVTGGGRGIGKTIALTLMREGAKVVIVGRTKSDLDKVVEEAGAAGGQMKAMRVDVSNETEIEEMVGETVKRFGKIDILVNNAGAVIMSPAEKMSTEQVGRSGRRQSESPLLMQPGGGEGDDQEKEWQDHQYLIEGRPRGHPSIGVVRSK